MISRIKAFLGSGGGSGGGGGGGGARATGPRHSFADLQVAAAALLVEAAEMDANFEAEERARILDLTQARFGLSAAEAESLVELAREEVGRAHDLYGFTRIVKDHFVHEERVELMEMLWEVGYADGKLDDREANLMRRIAGLIFVSDRESGSARKRAMRKLGMEP